MPGKVFSENWLIEATTVMPVLWWCDWYNEVWYYWWQWNCDYWYEEVNENTVMMICIDIMRSTVLWWSHWPWHCSIIVMTKQAMTVPHSILYSPAIVCDRESLMPVLMTLDSDLLLWLMTVLCEYCCYYYYDQCVYSVIPHHAFTGTWYLITLFWPGIIVNVIDQPFVIVIIVVVTVLWYTFYCCVVLMAVDYCDCDHCLILLLLLLLLSLVYYLTFCLTLQWLLVMYWYIPSIIVSIDD